jgi:hypothetical protein
MEFYFIRNQGFYMSTFIRGGFFANRKTQIMTVVGIMSAVAAYLVGDSDLFAMIQALIAVGGVYMFHKSKQNKGK